MGFLGLSYAALAKFLYGVTLALCFLAALVVSGVAAVTAADDDRPELDPDTYGVDDDGGWMPVYREAA